MALRWLKRICAKIKQWSDEKEEAMNQWRKEDPDNYYAFIKEQQRKMRGI